MDRRKERDLFDDSWVLPSMASTNLMQVAGWIFLNPMKTWGPISNQNGCKTGSKILDSWLLEAEKPLGMFRIQRNSSW